MEPRGSGPPAVPPRLRRNPAELAKVAAAKLTEDEHRRLYALIAQGQAMAAIKLYYEVTGAGLRASRDAVAALAAHPQPYRAAAGAPSEPEADDDDAPALPLPLPGDRQQGRCHTRSQQQHAQ